MVPCHEETTAIQRALGLLMGPVLGPVYVVYLPLVAISTTVVVVGGKILGDVLSVLKSLATVGWNPSESYASGKRNRGRR